MSSADAISRFNAVLAAYFRAWYRYHPETAVDLGVTDHAGALRPYGDDDVGALVALNEKLLDSLEEIDEGALDPERRLDLKLVRGHAVIELHGLVERDWRRRDPVAFLPVHAVYQLTVRRVPDAGAALAARLAAIPHYLRGARAHLLVEPEAVPPLWVASAVAEAEAGAGYLRGLRGHPLVAARRLEAALEQAAHALEDHARFLERELAPRAAGDFAAGRALFGLLLAQRHFLDVTPEALRAFGERLADETRAALRRVTRELRGDEDVAALTRAIQADHPPAGRLLESYREAMEAARAFVERERLVSLPPVQALEVVETPAFLRHQIPFAAYLEPQPNDARQLGRYYVTPPADDAALGEHNRTGIRHTSVHEAWPGHHLQFVTANLNPPARTPPRLLHTSATLYEGWALYCEQLMAEQGFLDAPESRFLLLKDRLWRALRVVIDVYLHTGGLAVEDAAGRMCSELGFTRGQALADLDWYSRAPTVPMGYAVGWALINAARDRLRAAPGFTLRGFHDRLLSAGSIALPLVLASRFGPDLWRAAAAEVFPPA